MKERVNKLTNIPTSVNNLKTKIDDLNVGNLKTVPVNLKKLSDTVGNEVVKNTKFNTLKSKVNNSEKKIPDTTNLIHINQYNTDKKLEMLIKNTSLVTTTVLNAKFSEVENKILNMSNI